MKMPHNTTQAEKIEGAKIAILQSKWYPEYCGAMADKCASVLEASGAKAERHVVPGCLEFPLCAQILLEKRKYDAVVCIGILMKGETHHFEMILQSCAYAMQEVSLKSGVPLVNTILPVTTEEQAAERSRGDEYNKGIEAALAVIEFVAWKRSLENHVKVHT